MVVTNAAGATTTGADETFMTTAPPAIDGLLAENLTAISAELQRDRSTPTASQRPTASNTGRPSPTARKSSGTIPASELRPGNRRAAHGPDAARRLPLPAGGRKQGRRQEEGGTTTLRRPHLQLLPAELPQRKRPPADPGQLPPRLPRLRARLAGRRRRHPALSRRPQHRATRPALALLLHRALVDDPRTPAAARSTASATSTSPPAPTPAGSRDTSACRPSEAAVDGGPAAGPVRPGRPAVPRLRHEHRQRRHSGPTSSRTTSSPTRA